MTHKTFVIAHLFLDARGWVMEERRAVREADLGQVTYATRPEALRGTYVRPGDRIVHIERGHEDRAWRDQIDEQLAIMTALAPGVKVEEVSSW